MAPYKPNLMDRPASLLDSRSALEPNLLPEVSH